MAKKLSVTEIETLTDYVSGIIVKEQRGEGFPCTNQLHRKAV